jgi:cytochrome b561
MKDLLQRIKEDLSSAYKSWTIWFNGMLGVAVVALPAAQENLPQLQEYLPADVYHYLMGALVLGNMLLRFKTSGRLADK